MYIKALEIMSTSYCSRLRIMVAQYIVHFFTLSVSFHCVYFYFNCFKEDIPSIASIRKRYRNRDYSQPYLHESGIMTGFKQCITITSNRGKYDETVKAVAMETESVADEEADCESADSAVEKGVEQVITFFRKDIHEEVAFNLCDSSDDQKPKQYYIDCIEILFNECTTGGGNKSFTVCTSLNISTVNYPCIISYAVH